MFLGPPQYFCVEVAYEFASRFCWGFQMFYDDHKTVLMNGWIICRFVEISEVSGDFLLDFALNMFLEKFTQLFHD